MASVASAALTEFQRQATGGRNPYLPSAVNSGLVGDATHKLNNSYHNSKRDNPNQSVGAYTNKWPNDTAAGINRDLVTGSDRSMNLSDMLKSWRLHKAVFDDHSDPRRKYLAEYIGTPDGVNARRLDFGDGSIDSASSDHTWHEHEGWWYLYAGSWQAADASLSIKRGETKEQYISRTQGGADMTPEESTRMYGAAWRIDTVINDLPAVPNNEETREHGVAGQENKLYARLNRIEDTLRRIEEGHGEPPTETLRAGTPVKGGK